jgi:hypothetical protein
MERIRPRTQTRTLMSLKKTQHAKGKRPDAKDHILSDFIEEF